MAVAEGPKTLENWCLFRCDSWPCAIHLASVSEVVQVERLTRFPLGPALLAGLFTVRREVVPVFSLAGRSSAGALTARGKTPVLVLQSERGRWGLLIDHEEIVLAEGIAEDERAASPGPPGATTRRVGHGGATYSVIEPAEDWHRLRSLIESAYRSRSAPTG